MIESFFCAVLAILGLGFLVFIHELGHYWIARKEGMKIEVFSIGFGKALYTWERNGVKWMICMLPFGGYVRIAGMQREGSREPYEIADGFYGKHPWQRIKVALAGPLVNIAFAFLAFAALWVVGGRTKQFSEFTSRIGWVDPQSALYQLGVRPGDVIQRYDGRPFHGFKDLLVASLMDDKTTRIEGYKIDYETGQKTNFDYTLKTYENPQFTKEKLLTIGVLTPASYLIYDGRGHGPFLGSPLSGSGIESGDRILWADGEMIFSVQQLSALTNESTVFLTIQRAGQIFHTKVPRIQLNDLKMTAFEKAEIGDWQYEAGLKGKLKDLYFIPYNLSPDGIVESRLDFLDPNDQEAAFQKCQRCAHFIPLEEGDRILAVDGNSFRTTHQFLADLQSRRVLMIVKRDKVVGAPVLWTQVDEYFEDFSIPSLASLIAAIGTDTQLQQSGQLYLLNPIIPKSKNEIFVTPEQQAVLSQELASTKKGIEAIRHPAKRSEALKQFEMANKKLILGLPLKDKEVVYNPNPVAQFKAVVVDTWRTLTGLVSGYLNPKHMSGPVGIVHVVHQSWMIGMREALFWMAMISLNLGIINLMPVPVLDGGHILFSLLELVRKRPLRSKTMERLIIPFVGLLIAFFIYITYQDIARLFSKFL